MKRMRKNIKTAIQLSDHFTYHKLLRFTFPTIVMMVFTSIYTVVDGYFVSNFAGKTAFAAVNLIFPFVMILSGMGFMIGTGGTALVSLVLGTGDRERANRYFSMMVRLTLLLGILLTVLGVCFTRPVAALLGATPEMMEDCVLYGRIVLLFTVAFMLQNVFQSFLIAAERPKLGLAAIVGAGVTNMILDALFVGILRWGVAEQPLPRHQPVCGRSASPVLFYPSQHKPSATCANKVGTKADPAGLRKRLLGADEQHLLLHRQHDL